jgi:hypothetical protein
MGGEEDFLWFMSSDFLLTLPELVARHRRQVVLLVIRDLRCHMTKMIFSHFAPSARSAWRCACPRARCWS